MFISPHSILVAHSIVVESGRVYAHEKKIKLTSTDIFLMCRKSRITDIHYKCDDYDLKRPQENYAT